jgi:hypothetical protein
LPKSETTENVFKIEKNIDELSSEELINMTSLISVDLHIIITAF